MSVKFTVAEDFGRAFVPKRFRPGIRRFFMRAGYPEVPYKFFGIMFYLGVLMTALVYIVGIYPILVERDVNTAIFVLTTFWLWVVIPLMVSLFFMLAIYTYLDVRIFNRTKKLEAVLQEFLRYVSENLRGGMAFEKALWDAIRPKFGILADEIRLAAKKVMTGQDVEEALNEFTDKYHSPMLKRSFSLIIEGIKGGANIADLIERIEKNLRETKHLKDEISVANTTFVIFISGISMLITPALFGLSYNLMSILKNLSARIGGGATGADLPFNLSGLVIDPQGFANFSIYALIASSAFSAMIVSIIRKGNIRQGIGFVPIYVIISLINYAFFRWILSLVMGSLMSL